VLVAESLIKDSLLAAYSTKSSTQLRHNHNTRSMTASIEGFGKGDMVLGQLAIFIGIRMVVMLLDNANCAAASDNFSKAAFGTKWNGIS
jgi:hypothetical protein